MAARRFFERILQLKMIYMIACGEPARCRFRDCSHASEPGCAIRAALGDGRLDRRRLESYLKLQRELHYFATRKDQSARLVEKAKWKRIHVDARKRMKLRGKF